jgi:hypothetical protein
MPERDLDLLARERKSDDFDDAELDHGSIDYGSVRSESVPNVVIATVGILVHWRSSVCSEMPIFRCRCAHSERIYTIDCMLRDCATTGSVAYDLLSCARSR